MKTSVNSLFSRVRRPFGRILLTLTLLAVLGLAADAAQALTVSNPTFNPNGTVTYGADSSGAFAHTTGTLAGTALPQGTNFVIGANYNGGPVNYVVGSTSSAGGTLQEFAISGTGSGVFSKTSDEFAGVYHFDLAATPGIGGLTVTITNWTLNYSVTTTGTGGGTTFGSASGSGTGDFTGTVLFPIAGADSGTSLTSYTASLSVTYSGPATPGAGLSVTVPNGSIDFNAIPNPVPEPGTWAPLLLAGGFAAGVRAVRVRFTGAR